LGIGIDGLGGERGGGGFRYPGEKSGGGAMLGGGIRDCWEGNKMGGFEWAEMGFEGGLGGVCEAS
jgi:hypothetical protein